MTSKKDRNQFSSYDLELLRCSCCNKQKERFMFYQNMAGEERKICGICKHCKRKRSNTDFKQNYEKYVPIKHDDGFTPGGDGANGSSYVDWLEKNTEKHTYTGEIGGSENIHRCK